MCQCKGVRAALSGTEERQVAVMEKKNPYIMTIGFKKEDPDHVYVAELLNSMKRGKAQYIVKAVLTYQNRKQNGEFPQAIGVPFDYDTIRRIIIQVIEEREKQIRNPIDFQIESEPEKIQCEAGDLLQEFDEAALSGIMESIKAFRSQ